MEACGGVGPARTREGLRLEVGLGVLGVQQLAAWSQGRGCTDRRRGLKCWGAAGGAAGRRQASEMGKEWAEGEEDTEAREGPTDCRRE